MVAKICTAVKNSTKNSNRLSKKPLYSLAKNLWGAENLANAA